MTSRAVRSYWAVCGLAGAVVAAGWFMTAGSLYLSGFIGAGESQQSFDFHRAYEFASDRSWLSVSLLAGAVCLTAIAVAGAASVRLRPLFAVAFAVAAATTIHLDHVGRFIGGLGEGGVYSCDEATQADPGRCAGPLLRRALRDFAADVRRGEVGSRPGFMLLEGYQATPRRGRSLMESSLVVAMLLSGYASIRLLVQRWWAAWLLLVAGVLAVLVWLFLTGLSALE
jgi:hypothetical protein